MVFLEFRCDSLTSIPYLFSKNCIWTEQIDFGHREKGKSLVTEGEHDFVILSFLVKTFPFHVDVYFWRENFQSLKIVPQSL